MVRSALALALTGALLAPLPAADPTPVEKQLALQTAMEAARKHLDARTPADAVAALEKEIANADGGKAFLSLLREAYASELASLEKSPAPDPEKLAQTRRKLALLGGEVKPTGASPPPLATPVTEPEAAPPVAPTGTSQPPLDKPGTDAAAAAAAFKAENYADADRLFAATGAARLTAEQKTAWAYCRIKLAADRVKAPACDAATASAAVEDVTAALELVPAHAELQRIGAQVLKAAQAKGGVRAVAPVAAGDALETASFRVRGGTRELADAVAKAAEAGRKQIFERWTGPAGGAWQPKCEIVIHATADAYAKATGKPAALTGHATVKLTDGRATERRIDLRADDAALVANALPRELTHVVLADLFAGKPPPKWALEGMAILAGSPEEISRYTRTLPRCARDGELRTLAALFDLKDFPADGITGFYCQSASVVEYLVKLNGERHFKIFLGAVQRYGVAKALKDQYGIASIQALEQDWKRVSLTP